MKNKILNILMIVMVFMGLGMSVRHDDADAIATPWGRIPGYFMVGWLDNGTITSTNINAGFLFASSTMGTTAGFHFSSHKNQTSGNFTVYTYCTAVTGSPTNSVAVLFPGSQGADDDDRPNGTAIATSSNVDMSGCSSAQWKAYTFTGVTLAEGQTYWLSIQNTTATPASNFFAIVTRGAADLPLNNAPSANKQFGSYTTTDGFTNDPTLVSNSVAPFVIKYDSGDIYGMPYVATDSAHASNANIRGFRVHFDEDVVIGGWGFNSAAGGTNLASTTIYQGSTVIKSILYDRNARFNWMNTNVDSVTLTGGLDYDFVITWSGNSSTGDRQNMGNTPPTDVTDLNDNFTYVDGATAGSLTETTTSIFMGGIRLETNPAISGGSATDVIGIIQ